MALLKNLAVLSAIRPDLIWGYSADVSTLTIQVVIGAANVLSPDTFGPLDLATYNSLIQELNSLQSMIPIGRAGGFVPGHVGVWQVSGLTIGITFPFADASLTFTFSSQADLQSAISQFQVLPLKTFAGLIGFDPALVLAYSGNATAGTILITGAPTLFGAASQIGPLDSATFQAAIAELSGLDSVLSVGSAQGINVGLLAFWQASGNLEVTGQIQPLTIVFGFADPASSDSLRPIVHTASLTFATQAELQSAVARLQDFGR